MIFRVKDKTYKRGEQIIMNIDTAKLTDKQLP